MERARMRQDSRQWVQDRRVRTRQLIELGGLVQKAGLGQEETAVLLGALLTIAQDIDTGGEAARRRYRRIGDRAFTNAGEGGKADDMTRGDQH